MNISTNQISKLGAIFAVFFMVFLATGCMRVIPTGEVGLRVDFNKQVSSEELLPGSWNQTIIGNVLSFPVREIPVEVNDRHPLSSDNSPMADFDITLVYSINPSSVSDIFSKKSKGFHDVDNNGEILLMHKYIETLIVNAENIAVRKYKSLEVNDYRSEIENDIRLHIEKELAHEGLAGALTITAVQIRNATPNEAILKNATKFVKSQNELKIKENEVKIAQFESERMNALAVNSGQSIAYMKSQAQLEIAKGVASGKVNAIIVPTGFNGIINVK